MKYIKIILTSVLSLLFAHYGPATYADANAVHRTPKTIPYKVNSLFHVGPGMGMQSVAYSNGYYYVGYATSTNHTIIQKYSSAGRLVSQTGVLPILHCASISVDPSTGYLIVTNGGGMDPTKVYVVDYVRQKILSTINLAQLGHSGLGAVDKATGNLWVETAPNDHGELTFSDVTLSGRILKQFHLANQGVPQGIDVENGLIYYYTDDKVSVISTSGKILRQLTVKEPGESEGMVILPSGQIVVGFQYRHNGTKVNTLYEINGFH